MGRRIVAAATVQTDPLPTLDGDYNLDKADPSYR
jgi:hypothetical protein